MKKLGTRFGVLAAVTMFLAACGLIQIPVSLPIGEWFASSGSTISGGTGPDGVFSATESGIQIPSDDLQAFSRGGVTLSGLSISGGSVAPSTALQGAIVASVPTTLEIKVFVGATTADTLLAEVEIGITDGSTLDPSRVEVVDQSTFDDAIAIIKANDTITAKVEIRVLDESGAAMANYDFTIEGLSLDLTVAPI